MRKLIFLALIAAMAALPGMAAAQATKGNNGGPVVKSEGHPIEFLRNGLDITFYVGDDDGSPLPTKDMKGRATVQNAGKTVTGGANGAPAAEQRKRQAEHIDEEKILRCLGAAVILHWNTIPTQLQRALLEAASNIQGARTPPLKDALAQFLHDHKNDAQRQQQGQSGS